MFSSQKDFYKKLLGRVGEKRAVKHLKKVGHTILKTNYVTPFGEIDIISRDGEYLVFTEVKTRTDESFGYPSEAVTAKKRKKYQNCANYYLISEKLRDIPCRFDVVEVLKGEINYIKDAFFL